MLTYCFKIGNLIAFMGMMFLFNSCGSTHSVSQNKKALSKPSADEIFMLGQRMKLQQRPQKAIHYFTIFSKIKPKVATGYFEIARQYNLLNKQDSVLYYARKAAQMAPENKWMQQFYARTLANRKKYEEAAFIFHQLHKKHPNTEHYLSQEIFMWTADKRYEKALRMLDSMEERNGVSEALVLQKQWIYLELGALDSAEKQIEQLIAMQPDNYQYYSLLAKLYAKYEEPQKAIKLYQDLLKRQPENVYALLALSVIYKKTHESDRFRYFITRVFESPDLKIEDKIDFVRPFLKYVEVDTAERADAIWLSKLLTKLYPKSYRAHKLLGDMFYRCEKSDSALISYGKALDVNDNEYHTWHQVMLIFLEQDRIDTLLVFNQKAIQQFPKNVEAVMIRGMAFFHRRQYKKAVTILQKTLEMKVKTKETKKIIYQSLAAAFAHLHKNRKARKYRKMFEELDKKQQSNALKGI